MLKSISLQNFRNYKKATFNFSSGITLIIGPNTIGKTNILEAVFLISTGKSFRTDKDFQMLEFGKEVGRVCAYVNPSASSAGSSQASSEQVAKLEVVITNGNVSGVKSQYKKFPFVMTTS